MENEMHGHRTHKNNRNPKMNATPIMSIHPPERTEMTCAGRQYVPNNSPCCPQKHEGRECHGINHEVCC
jgi:hypothetical protein